MRPSDAIAETKKPLRGMPVNLAGSCVAAETYGLSDWADLDGFVPSEQMLIATVQTLLDVGYTMNERFDRVWYRWLRYGLKGWHTNSMKLHSPSDVEVNIVYKVVDGHAATSLAQVLESFDFGLLATGYELEHDKRRDLRPYLFPGYDLDGPLPMMPNKRDNWVRGFISQYNGLREAARYAKYYQYGYDMSLIKKDLITGYEAAALYHSSAFEEDKQLLGQIYYKLAEKIQGDEVVELLESYVQLDFKDPLDLIMERLD